MTENSEKMDKFTKERFSIKSNFVLFVRSKKKICEDFKFLPHTEINVF